MNDANPEAPSPRRAHRAERGARVGGVRRGASVHGDGGARASDVRAVLSVEARETAADGAAAGEGVMTVSNQASESISDAAVRLLRRAVREPDRVARCRCGCAGVATYIVEGIERPGGKPFFEGACATTTPYLAECASEFGDPFIAVQMVSRGAYGPPYYHVRARRAEPAA